MSVVVIDSVPKAGPRVSIIIPTYNYARFLPETLESAFRQSEKSIEIIVVDDGSTDQTKALLSKYDDPRLITIHQENQGLAMARNNGAKMAKAPYLVFLDADDIMEPDKIRLQADVLDENPGFSVCYHDAWRITETGEIYDQVKYDWCAPVHGDARMAVCISCFLYPFTAMVRKTAFETIGFFDPEFVRGEDWDFWFRASISGHRYYFIDKPLGRYRAHQKGTFSGHGRILDQFKSVARCLRQQNEVLKGDDRLTRWHKYRFAFVYTGIGMALTHLGRHRRAQGAYRAAMRILPNIRTAYWAGLNALNSGDVDEARRLFRLCIEKAAPDDIPNRAGALFLLGKIAIRNKNIPTREAQSFFQDVIRLNPRHARACMNVLRLNPGDGKAREGVTFHQQNNPYGTAVMAFQERAMEIAEEMLQQLLKREDGDIRPLFYLGRIALHRKEYRTALGYFAKLLDASRDVRDGIPDNFLSDASAMFRSCRQALGEISKQNISNNSEI